VFAALVGTGVVALPLRDFVEYWTAGDVFLRGGNPYDAEALSESLRNSLGMERPAITMMWNPPWTLPLTVPFAFLPIRLAHVLWVAVQLALVLYSLHLLTKVYAGLDEVRGRLRAATLLFPPTVYLVVYGQIGGVCLFGVAGFLYFLERGRPCAAGVCVALTAIKPHLLFVFGLYLLLEAVVSRPVRLAVVSGTVAVLLSAGAAWLINPHVYSDYASALNAPPGTAGYVTVREWKLPLGSYWLRMGIDPDQFWLQFVPIVIASLAAVLIWWRTRRNRNWPRITPSLILLSLLAAPYGGWLFDLVLLLVPVCHAASAIRRTHGMPAVNHVLAGFIALNAIVLVVIPAVTGLWLDEYYWFTPLVAVGYLGATWKLTQSNIRAAEE
jgi:hypothetical protein